MQRTPIASDLDLFSGVCLDQRRGFPYLNIEVRTFSALRYKENGHSEMAQASSMMILEGNVTLTV